jgi:defect-in-organelle-trafficking protein DotD
MGNAPAIPVLINLTVRDQSIAQILRMIDYQAGQKANIKIYPNRKTIELRYAKV